ncbi:MAG: nucleotidyltransferase domain-containing protein [Chloroflexota bacterium]|nr:nucleotidyltransferase domain-containing protein [Chloroflexota bacterium]
MNNEIARVVAELRRQLDALYGPRLVQVILYGSQARGDAEDSSDIDVLVVLKGAVQGGEEIERTGDIVTDLSLRYNTVISLLFMSDEHWAHRQGPLLRNIRREGIAV